MIYPVQSRAPGTSLLTTVLGQKTSHVLVTGFEPIEETEFYLSARSRRRRISQALVDGGFGQGELVAYFQPQHNLAGEVVGAEALARWRLRSGEVLLPSDFLPTVRRLGLSDALTYTMIDQALHLSDCWTRRFGTSIRVAFNIDPNAVADSVFLDHLATATRQSGVRPENIAIEILEESIADSNGDTIDALSALRKCGYRVSIDDFGTGSSGLQRLLDMQADEVKIARPFVHGVSCSHRKATIVESIVRMAHRMGMTTVLEGLEMRDDVNWIATLLTPVYLQGFALSRPMTHQKMMSSVSDDAKFSLEPGVSSPRHRLS